MTDAAAPAILITVLVLIALAVLVHRFAAFPTVVRSDAMRPLLEPGDVVLTSRHRRPHRLRRGEILVYRVPDRAEPDLRRVIGLPGERVVVDPDGRITVDGQPLYEPYARRSGSFRGSFAVPRDRVFVLGDQRAGTHDPQAWQQSFVAEGTILGVARLRVFPWPIVDTHVHG
ncbi:signal peptidase I [Agromyces binzhouensis]|uniref:signal peptidase I n=1 Tax=Agromyces binzhouensis TaxID=1817495 RepID=UPI0013EDFAC1|nr:signal peptidase I [Agromyces binzhouensis]